MGFDFALNLPQFNNDEYDPEKIRAFVDEIERMYAALIAEPVPQTVKTIITTSYTAGSELVMLVDDDAASGAVTISLPPAAAMLDKVYHIKKIGSTGNVTTDPDGSETIDESATLVMTTQYDSIMIISDGVEWWLI